MLDTSTPTLDADGLPVGEDRANPVYWDDPELEQEWRAFLQGAAKLSHGPFAVPTPRVHASRPCKRLLLSC